MYSKITTFIEGMMFNVFNTYPLSYYVNRINMLAAIWWFTSNMFNVPVDSTILLTFVATMHGIVYAPNTSIRVDGNKVLSGKKEGKSND